MSIKTKIQWCDSTVNPLVGSDMETVVFGKEQ